MGVEQDAHAASHPQDASSSSGSGSKNEGVIVTWPASAPNRRHGTGSFTGTRRTAGSLPRMMTISSPASASAMSCERWVFALCMVTFFTGSSASECRTGESPS